MADLATIGFRADTRDLKKAQRDLKSLERQGGNTERRVSSMSSTFRRFSGVVAALGLGALARDILNTNRQFESLRASLETATGSAQNAEIAFKGIQEFASTTPFAVDEVTQAFIRLANLGLAPTERALTSYGNVAGAMSKSIMQFVEAVADATTGEFERLKEFGIKASTEGDRITFRFRGVEKEVQNSAGAIEDYLISLGEVEFAGGMERQAETLNGAISNLGDAWDAFVDGLLDSDNESKITKAVRFVTSGIETITDALDGQLNSVAEINRAIAYEQEQLQTLMELQLSPRIGRTTAVFGKVGLFASDDDISRALFETRTNIIDLEKDLASVTAEAEKSDEQFDKLAESLDTSSNAIDKSKTKLTEQEKAIARARESLSGMLVDLRTQVETFGQSEAEILKYRLTVGDLSKDIMLLGEEGQRLIDSMVSQQKTLDGLEAAQEAEREAQEEANRVREEAKSILEELKTPEDEYIERLQKISELQRLNELTTEQANMARSAAAKTYDEAIKKTGELDSFTKRAAENMQDAMGDFFFDFMQGELGNLEDSFKRTIDRMVAEALAANLGKKLFGGMVEGGSGEGLVGSLASAAFGFFGGGAAAGPAPSSIMDLSMSTLPSLGGRATGGLMNAGAPYMVGERGPEMIIPTIPSRVQPNTQSGGTTIINNISVTGVRDQGGLKRTESQIAQAAGRASQRALGRNS